MPQINQLPTRTVSAGDLIPFYSSNNGDAAKMSVTALAAEIADINSTSSASFATQYESVSDGFTVSIDSYTTDTWLILSPVLDNDAGAIVLPSSSNATHGMTVKISVYDKYTGTLAVTSTGATVYMPTPFNNIPKGGCMVFQYDSIGKIWYVISYFEGYTA